MSLFNCSLLVDQPFFLPGSLPPNSRQEPSISRSISINILSASGSQNNLDSEQPIPSGIMQLLRTILPGDVHMEDASSRLTTTSSVLETAEPSTATAEAEAEAEAEPRATDEGIFLSNLLREIMPLISQSGGAEPNDIPPVEARSSGHQRPQDSSTNVSSFFSCSFNGSLYFMLLLFWISYSSQSNGS